MSKKTKSTKANRRKKSVRKNVVPTGKPKKQKSTNPITAGKAIARKLGYEDDFVIRHIADSLEMDYPERHLKPGEYTRSFKLPIPKLDILGVEDDATHLIFALQAFQNVLGGNPENNDPHAHYVYFDEKGFEFITNNPMQDAMDHLKDFTQKNPTKALVNAVRVLNDSHDPDGSTYKDNMERGIAWGMLFNVLKVLHEDEMVEEKDVLVPYEITTNKEQSKVLWTAMEEIFGVDTGHEILED